jgi:1-aminocyclopropane-1-carboxylate deaminase/D-cysteine desulfhydrase-like pyridoxal-dependent ACC family enzyme
VLRTDLLHPHISGNKWFKLKYNLEEAAKTGYRQLLTFGGAYSNHIGASASAGKLFGFETIGIIRGEETLPLNPILSFAKKQGMRMYYISRSEYRRRSEADFLDELKLRFPQAYIVPEGGSNTLAVKGCSEILHTTFGTAATFDLIACACGTGATLAGLIAARKQAVCIGFPVLKGGDFLISCIEHLLAASGLPWLYGQGWCLDTRWHFGGYAKKTPSLLQFMEEFTAYTAIPVEPVYTGKMFYGLLQNIEEGNIKPGSRVLAIHTGGLWSDFDNDIPPIHP